MIFKLKEPSKAAPLFADWEDPDASIAACLDNVMGKVFADDPEQPKSAMALIGDFAFFAGGTEPGAGVRPAGPVADRRTAG